MNFQPVHILNLRTRFRWVGALRFLWLGLLWGACSLPSYAQSPEDQFMLAYNLIQQAERTPDAAAAQRLLKTAQTGLLQLQRNHPNWNERVIRFRLRYIADYLTRLQDHLPAEVEGKETDAAGQTAPAGAPSNNPLDSPPNEVLEHFNELNRQIQQLSQDRQTLEARLREALSAQPAPIDPREFQEALNRVNSLQATNQALLKRIEAQARERQDLIDRVVAEETQHALEETRRQLARQETLVSRLEQERQALQERLQNLIKSDVQPLQAENQSLKRQVQELSSNTQRDSQVAELAGELAQLQEQLELFQEENSQLASEKKELEKQLARYVSRDPEGGLNLIEKLEAELAVAKADVQRQNRRLEDLDEALELERTERQRLAEENERLLSSSQVSEPAAPAAVAGLQQALEQEQATARELQTNLEAALAQLAAVQTGDPSLALASLNLLSQQNAAQEVRQLRQALQASGAREKELEAALQETRRLKDRIDSERRSLEKQLVALAEQPPLRSLPNPERNAEEVGTSPGRGEIPATDVLILEARIRRLENERTDLERRILALTRTALEAKPKRRFFPALGSRDD